MGLAARLRPLHRRLPLDAVIMVASAASLAVLCSFYYIKPHSDFVAFRDAGHALLAGDWQGAVIRAPLYPLVLVVAGKVLSFGYSGSWPLDQAAASILNACLLPVNVWLCWLIGRQFAAQPCNRFTQRAAHMNQPAAGVSAWLFAGLPLGLQMTGHTLLEPLLTTAVLATIFFSGRNPLVAYACAAIASLTRYDAAGLIVGCLFADLLRSRGKAAIMAALMRTALAMLPLALWMGLLASLWNELRASRMITHGHEIAALLMDPQSRELPGLRWGQTLEVFQRTILPVEGLRVPLWAPQLRFVGQASLVFLVIGGAVVWLVHAFWRRCPATVVGAVGVVLYVVIHAAFPMQFERYAYPFAGVLLAWSAAGVSLACQRVAAKLSHGARGILFAAGCLVAAVLLWSEVQGLGDGWLALTPALRMVTVVVAGTMVALCGVYLCSRAGWSRALLLLAATWLACIEARLAPVYLGRGNEMATVVQAYRWAGQHASNDGRVLSASPGLVRLYANATTSPSAFVSFNALAADEWTAILREARDQRVRWIVWYDSIIAEHGAYYIQQLGLRRFEKLPELPGVSIAAEFGPRPRAWVLEVGG